MEKQQTYLLSLPTLAQFLGWHGGFLLTTIAVFKYVIAGAANGCPCVGHVPYGVAMFTLPALSVWMVAFCAYFLRNDRDAPWDTIKAYYVIKWPCARLAVGEDWELHSGLFQSCHQCQRSWRRVKLCACVYISVIYPLLWLALEFYHVSFYTCAKVGPDPDGTLRYCDNWKGTTFQTYTKEFALATGEAALVGNVLVVVDIVWVATILMTYVILQNKVTKYYSDPDDTNEFSESMPNEARAQAEAHVSWSSIRAGSIERRTSTGTRDTKGGRGAPIHYQGLHQQRKTTGYTTTGHPTNPTKESADMPDPEGRKKGDELPRYHSLRHQRPTSNFSFISHNPGSVENSIEVGSTGTRASQTSITGIPKGNKKGTNSSIGTLPSLMDDAPC